MVGMTAGHQLAILPHDEQRRVFSSAVPTPERSAYDSTQALACADEPMKSISAIRMISAKPVMDKVKRSDRTTFDSDGMTSLLQDAKLI